MHDRSHEMAAVPLRGVSAKPWLLGSGLAVAVIALIKFAINLYASHGYGFFVDELYFLDCAHHLDWGYVDQPP